MDDRQEIIHQLTAQLERAVAVRRAASADPAAAAARDRLRGWQAARLARTHADLLASPRFARSAAFFLSDIYGPNDLGELYAETGRVVPAMSRLLPTGGLTTVAHAIELDAISEELDSAMAAQLGAAEIDAAAYGRTYRGVGRRSDRERQIQLIEEVGTALERLSRKPLIGATLAMMRLPARMAGLEALQDFLERGYDAFSGTQGVDEFLTLVVTRERALMNAVFAEDDAPLSG
jgi:hypothetical protein